MSFLDGLNPAQLEAVQTVQGPLLIVAGPGSGKTRVIVHRIANLIQNEGVSPWNVLAVTFTNKAAREMRERLDALLGRGAESLSVGTFHSQCSRILRRYGQIAGIDPRFAIFDDGDQIEVVRRILRDLEIDDKRFPPRSFLSAISAAKSELITPRAYLAGANGYWQERVATVFQRYENALNENRALDFDDLIGETVRLFRESTDILELHQERYRYIMVDEFQDTNIAQYELVKLLGAKYRNVCIVGDEDQSVYSWRMADIRNLLNFEQEFPELKIIMLEQNYRSTQTILEVAQSVINGNSQRKPKRLWTENEKGRPVVLHEAYNEEDEAQFVIREVERLQRSEEISLSDVAVMYRTNAQSRPLEDAFVRRGMPYKLIGGTRFYERREVKDILAYLRLALNPNDTMSLQRVLNVPPRGIGDRTVAEIQRWAGKQNLSLAEALDAASEEPADGATPILQTRPRRAVRAFVDLIGIMNKAALEFPPGDVLELAIERSGYAAHIRDGTVEGEARWENITELRTKTRDFAELGPPQGLAALLEEVTLVQDVDSYVPESEGVTLITLHAAKGLEFPFVFIVGMEEGLCPHSRAVDDPTQMEEERRLVYVGITRAMRGLFLLHAYRRTLYGNTNSNQASRFLVDIPFELTSSPFGARTERPAPREVRPPPPGREARVTASVGTGVRPGPVTGPPPPPNITEQAYQAGDKVFHPAFGTGVVVSSALNRGDEEVTVAFEGKGVKKLSVAYAPLRRA